MGPALFLTGDRSGYVKASARSEIERLFPGAVIETVADAGHWVHADRPKQVVDALARFLPGG